MKFAHLEFQQKGPETRAGGPGAWAFHSRSRGELKYQRGREAIKAGRPTGVGTFKVRIRSCAKSRAITTEFRMIETRTGTPFNIVEVDAVTDPIWVYIVAEQGTPA